MSKDRAVTKLRGAIALVKTTDAGVRTATLAIGYRARAGTTFEFFVGRGNGGGGLEMYKCVAIQSATTKHDEWLRQLMDDGFTIVDRPVIDGVYYTPIAKYL